MASSYSSHQLERSVERRNNTNHHQVGEHPGNEAPDNNNSLRTTNNTTTTVKHQITVGDRATTGLPEQPNRPNLATLPNLVKVTSEPMSECQGHPGNHPFPWTQVPSTTYITHSNVPLEI